MDQLKQILELSPPVALCVGLNFIGLFLKRSPIPNWTIPMILIVAGGAVFPFIAEVGKVNYECNNPQVLNAIYGCVIGGASVGLNQVFRQILYRFGWKDDEEKKPTDPPAPPTA